jgi:hypothetical protein
MLTLSDNEVQIAYLKLLKAGILVFLTVCNVPLEHFYHAYKLLYHHPHLSLG